MYLTFFLNSALVSVIVVTITMLISIPAAFALSRAILGLGLGASRQSLPGEQLLYPAQCRWQIW